MKVLLVDDEDILLEHNTAIVRELISDAEIAGYNNADDMLREAENNGVDVAFMDICIPGTTGIELAKKLMEINPRVNIIFVTGYDDYREEAMDIFVSGYVKKPVTKEKIMNQIAHLRYPVENDKRIRIKTDGYFEVRIDGELVSFLRKKTEEFLAYLIYMNGEPTGSYEIRQVLFGDNSDSMDQSISYFSHVKRDLKNTLKKYNLEDALLFRNNREYSIDMSQIKFDLQVNERKEALLLKYKWRIKKH